MKPEGGIAGPTEGSCAAINLNLDHLLYHDHLIYCYRFSYVFVEDQSLKLSAKNASHLASKHKQVANSVDCNVIYSSTNAAAG